MLVLGDIDASSNQINVETVRIEQEPPMISCEIITIVEGNSARKAYLYDLSPSPSYVSFIRKADRTEAQVVLLDWANRQAV